MVSKEHLALCRDIGAALAKYHGEKPGDFASYVQAANMLLVSGIVTNATAGDFLEITQFEPH